MAKTKKWQKKEVSPREAGGVVNVQALGWFVTDLEECHLSQFVKKDGGFTVKCTDLAARQQVGYADVIFEEETYSVPERDRVGGALEVGTIVEIATAPVVVQVATQAEEVVKVPTPRKEIRTLSESKVQTVSFTPDAGKAVKTLAPPVGTGQGPTGPLAGAPFAKRAKKGRALANELLGKLSRTIEYPDSNPDLIKNFSGVKVGDFKRGINQHGTLHDTRRFLEQDAYCVMLTHDVTAVWDIGGVPHRSGKVADLAGMRYHSCNPVLSAQDVNRNRLYSSRNAGLYCTHVAQDCHCIDADVALFTHTLYYFSPEELKLLLLRTRQRVGYAIVHHFDSTGRFAFNGKVEAEYVVADGQLEMAVRGNNFSYKHSDMRWLQTQNAVNLPSGGTLVWTLQKEALGQRLYLLSYCAETVACDPPETTHSAYRTERVKLRRVRVVTNWWARLTEQNATISERDECEVEVYPTLVHDIEWILMNKPVTQITQNQAGARAREFIQSKSVKEDPRLVEISRNSLNYGLQKACVAWNETQVTNSFLGPLLDVKFAQGLLPYKSFYRWFVEWCLDLKRAVGEFVLLVVLMSLGMWFFSVVERLFSRAWTTARVNPRIRPVRFRVSADLVRVEFDALKRTCDDNAAKLAAALSDKLTTRERQLLLHKYGTTVLNNMVIEDGKPLPAPVAYILTEEYGQSNAPQTSLDANRASALVHRLGKGTGHSHPDVVEEMLKTVARLSADGVLTPNASDLVSIPSFEEWVTMYYGRRNEAHKVAALRAAYEETLVKGLPKEFVATWFVKDEAAPAKSSDNKCRGIFIPDDDFNASLGPYSYAITKTMAKMWNKDNHIMMSSGVDASEVAQWMSRAVSFYSRCAVIEIDVSRFEANITQEQNRAVFGVFSSWYKDPTLSHLLSLMDRVKIKDKRRKTVLDRPGATVSGVGLTTGKNTMHTLLGFAGYLYSVGKDIRQVQCIILGDDNYSVIPAEWVELGLVTASGVEEYYRNSVGWEVKVKVRVCDDLNDLAHMEFCSCYFALTDSGPLYTPKAGRIVGKTFSLNAAVPLKQHQVMMRGMIRGLGHFQCGYILTNVLLALDASFAETVMPGDPIWVDWFVHPQRTGEAIVSNPHLGREVDCVRYGFTPEQCDEAIQAFVHCLRKSRFPEGPIRVPKGTVWDRIFAVDMPSDVIGVTDRRDLAEDTRDAFLEQEFGARA